MEVHWSFLKAKKKIFSNPMKDRFPKLCGTFRHFITKRGRLKDLKRHLTIK